MSSVFIIINEWTDNRNNEGAEVVGSNFFTSEDSAWDHLQTIAESYEYDLEQDSTAFGIENPVPHLQYEEYYIQQLDQEGN